jgi:hypothetical protein
MSYSYIYALLLLCVSFAFTVIMMKRFLQRTRLANALFSALVYIPYITLCCIVFSDVGFYDWNFRNTLPVANVSPFMFSSIPLLFLLPKRVRPHLYLLISLLSVGMLGSTVLACINNAAIGYKFHFHFLLDYIAHVSLSLFGIYLLRSGQARFSAKNCLISSSLLVGSAVLMLILNIIFDTAFFGLSLSGKHNIYNVVLVKNSYLSALLYFSGLIGVLALGAALCSVINRRMTVIQQFASARSNEPDYADKK